VENLDSGKEVPAHRRGSDGSCTINPPSIGGEQPVTKSHQLLMDNDARLWK